MKTTKASLLTAVAAALLALGSVNASAASAATDATATSAAPTQRYERMHGKHMSQEQWQQRRAQRAQALKDRLNLTAEQQPAWDAFMQAMQPQPHARLDRSGMANLTTPERIDRMRTLRVQRDAELDRRGEAVKTFYAALTPEQQKIFDTRPARADHRAAKQHRGWRHHGDADPKVRQDG